MIYYVGITDWGWFDFLSQRRPSEVNFWRPMARTPFRTIERGSPFLFKLHKPNHFIVGGGFFSGYSHVPLSYAWDTFGENNGCASSDEFRAAIHRYRASRGLNTVDPDIGCIVLSDPFFFKEPDWIDAPHDWGDSIVQGKRYNTDEHIGRDIWQQVVDRLTRLPVIRYSDEVRETPPSYVSVFGNEYLRRARLGQGAFRLVTLENFERTCCVTGETTVPVLEAAHICPVTMRGDHSVQNGLLLRADIHILYDSGLIGVTPEYRIRISERIKDQYLNGRVYYTHQNCQLRSLPEFPELRPDPDLLRWHMNHVFVE